MEANGGSAPDEDFRSGFLFGRLIGYMQGWKHGFGVGREQGFGEGVAALHRALSRLKRRRAG